MCSPKPSTTLLLDCEVCCASASPGLKGFEAPGVRDVRNQLLEHPEGKNSTVIENGRSYSLTDGPIVKGTDKVEIFPDRGLYVNAEEFRAELVQRLLEQTPKLGEQA